MRINILYKIREKLFNRFIEVQNDSRILVFEFMKKTMKNVIIFQIYILSYIKIDINGYMKI